MNAPPEFNPDDISRELLADDQFLTDLAEEFRDQYDQMRKDLRKLLEIPAGHQVSDAELISRIGTVYIAARAVLEEFFAGLEKEGAA